tara:strand:+ start:29340 stop:29870 length:531 start_codon:yes stop_codon:yes gene_type:complete
MAERGEFGPPGFGPSKGGGEPSISLEEFVDRHLKGWNLHTNPNNPYSSSFSYSGPVGWGYGTIDPKGIGWDFNPSAVPGLSIQGHNFDPTGLSYGINNNIPGLGLNFNLDQDFNPSLDFDYYGTPGVGLLGSYDFDTGSHNLQGTMNNLFGVQGLNLDANYGSGGYGAGISYGGDL